MGHLSTPRRILVTGASRGIGEEAARQLARAGHRVVLAARSEAALRAAAERIAEEGPRPEVVVFDVTDPASVAAGVARASAGGAIDVLVNNAGACHQAPFLAQPPGTAEAELALNYLGAVNTTRAVLPAMLARGAGTIVNVSSLLGTVACPTTATYCASKAALEAFSHALRGEVARRGVRVVVYVAPHTQTAMGLATRFDGVRSLPVPYTAAGLVRAIDRRPRRYAPSPVYRLLLRLAGLAPAFLERRVAASVERLLSGEGALTRAAGAANVSR